MNIKEKSKKYSKYSGKKKATRNFIEILKNAGDWDADPRAVPTIAKSIFRKFKDQGFTNENIMSLASELLNLVTQNIRGEDEQMIPPLAAKVVHTLQKMAVDVMDDLPLETPPEDEEESTEDEEESPDTLPIPGYPGNEDLPDEERYEQYQAKQDMAKYLADKLNMDPNVLLNLLEDYPSFNITSDIAKSVVDKINILTKLKIDGPEVYGQVIESLEKKADKTLDERIVMVNLLNKQAQSPVKRKLKDLINNILPGRNPKIVAKAKGNNIVLTVYINANSAEQKRIKKLESELPPRTVIQFPAEGRQNGHY
jgi:hypothetical protein